VSDKTVYRTTDASVIAAYCAAQDALTAYRQQIGEVLERHGVGDVTRFGTTGYQPGRFAGLARHGMDEVAPAGWRLNTKLALLVPDLRTSAGKAARKALDALGYPGDPRDALPGMPSHLLAGYGRFLTCGVQQLGDALYVTWSATESELGDAADRAIWELAKLSEYYAAAEQAAETAGAS
jgi:hypothetical protein